jgi:Cupin domain
MSSISFQQFEDSARAEGFDEVIERQWAADTVVPTHQHAFAVSARVVEGSLQLTVGGQTRHLQAGDRFELDADVPHAEHYGAEGARFWVARRNRPAAGTR